MKISNKLRGRLLVLVLFATILNTSGVVLAKEVPETLQKESFINAASEITPRGAIYYEKTVKKTYYSYSEIPEYIVYSEYNNTYESTFSGKLYLISVVKSGTSFMVTFKGTLSGSGL